MNEADRPIVLFIADDTVGAGPVGRALALATRAASSVRPYLVALSDVAAPALAGMAVENLPSRRALGMARDEWCEVVARRVRGIVSGLRPTVAVVDAPEPARPIVEALAGTTSVWVRSGLGMPGGAGVAEQFDAVLEPLDLASGFDPQFEGSLVPDDPHAVRPISLVDAADMMGRDDARRALGLPAVGAAVSLNVPVPHAHELVRLVTRLRDEVRRSAPDATVFVPTEISAGRLPDIDGVVVRPARPLGRYLHAFDAAISTAAYESFHEAVLSGTPTIFVTDSRASTDGEHWRAKAAATGGFGLHVEDVTSPVLERAVTLALDPATARTIRTVAMAAHPGNGAIDAAHLVVLIAQGSVIR
jgi:hypothetical protein